MTILNVEVANATKGHEIPQNLSKQKVILKYFFSWHGIMHHEFIPGGTTLKKDRYKQILTIYIGGNAPLKCSEMWVAREQIPLCANALTYSSLLVSQQLTKTISVVLPYPPYSHKSCDVTVASYHTLKTGQRTVTSRVQQKF